jgi:hypothetical protein
VFVSSTLHELAKERVAARQAIISAGYVPIMFDDGARWQRAQDVYRSLLEQSEIFVGIYWKEYGSAIDDTGISGIEEEYNLSTERPHPRLIYVRRARKGSRDARLTALIDRIESENTYHEFGPDDDLQDRISKDVKRAVDEFSSRGLQQLTPLSTMETVPIASLPAPTPGSQVESVGKMGSIELIGIRPRPHIRRWIAGLTAGAVILGTMITLFITQPWRAEKLTPPTDLKVQQVTTDSVGFSWLAPANSATPNRYLIFENGERAGSVPGGVTYYNAPELGPATAYEFQVEAVSGADRSPRSASMKATTVTPPPSTGILNGTWQVSFKITKASHKDLFFYRRDKTWSDTWKFASLCATNPCAVRLLGRIIDNYNFESNLSLQGSAYSGIAITHNFEYCGYASVGRRYGVPDQLTITIRISKARTLDKIWTATSWTGTLSLFSPYTRSPAAQFKYCKAYTVAANISATRSPDPATSPTDPPRG